MKKKSLLSIITLVLAACAVGFMFSIGAFAQRANASNEVFTMVSSDIRTDENSGLRIIAKVDEATKIAVEADETQTFGAVIVPNEYFAQTGVSKEGDFITALQDAGKTVLVNDDLKVSNVKNEDGTYNIRVTLTDVNYYNLAREFYGVIYIKTADGYVFADNAIVISPLQEAANSYGAEGEDNSVISNFILKGAYVKNNPNLDEEEVDSAIAGKTIESEYATSITETSKSVYTYVDSTTYEIPFTNKAFLNDFDAEYVSSSARITAKNGIVTFNGSAQATLDIKVLGTTYTINFNVVDDKAAIEQINAGMTALEGKDLSDAYQGAGILDVYGIYDRLTAKEVEDQYITQLDKLKAAYANYTSKYVLTVKMDADPEKFYEDEMNYGHNIKAMYAEQDEKFGEVLVMETLSAAEGAHGGHAVTVYTGLEGLDLSKCEYVFFYVYNGGTATGRLLGKFNGPLNDNVASLNPGEWTLVKVEASTFQTSGAYMGFLNFEQGATYKFSAFFGMTKAGLVDSVVEAINAIPSEDEANVYELGSAIANARAAYDSLSNELKSLVPFDAIDKLAEIEMSFGAKYKVVAPVDSTAIFTEYVNDSVNFSVEDTAEYSKVLVATAKEELAADANFFKVAYSTAVDLSNCNKVYVDVYNGGAATAYFGAIYNNVWNTSLVALAAGEWTKVEIDVDGLQAGAFGIFGIEAAAQYKFSMFYANTVKTTAESVVAMINALPETITGADITKIEAARKAYNSLFDDDQALVDNVAKLEAAEAFYAEHFAVALKTDSLANISDKSSNYSKESVTVLSIVDDATYGKVFKIVQAGSGAVAFTYNTISDEVLAQYKEIVFNVYATSAHPFDAAASGNFTGNGKTLTAGAWTTITYSVPEYLAIRDGEGRFGIWGAATGEYAVASIYLVSYTEEIAALIELIEGLTTDNVQAVLDARAAYNALPSTAQAKITNIAKLDELEQTEAFHAALVKRVEDKIDSIPEDLQGYSIGVIELAKQWYAELPEDVKGDVDADKLARLAELEEEYYELYTIVATPESYKYNGDMGGSYVGWNIVNDDTYGKALKFTRDTDGGVAFNFTASKPVNTFYQIKIAVYASLTGAGAGANIKGSWVTNYAPLTAGEWTIVTINGLDLTKDIIGVWGGEKNGEYMFSVIWAENIEVEQATLDLIATIETLDGTDAAAVAAAREAYEALAPEQKGLVSNVSKLIVAEYKVAAFAVDAILATLTEQSSYEDLVAARAALTALSIEEAAYVNAELVANLELLEQNFVVQIAIDAIDAIPETLQGAHYGLIQIAKAAVAAIPEDKLELVTNLADLEAAEAEYAKYYSVVSVPENYGELTTGWIDGGATVNAVIANDDVYGNVYQVAYAPSTGEKGNLAIQLNAEDISKFTTIYVNIYNGTEKDANALYLSTGGSWTEKNALLTAGEWTTVKYNVSDFNNSYVFGVYNAYAGVYKFSVAYSESEAKAIANAIEAIDALPEVLEGYHGSLLANVEATIELISAEGKAQITNIATYEAAKAAYDAKYVLVLPITSAEAFYEKSATFGELSTAKVVNDQTYGPVLVRDIHTAGAQVNYYDGGLNLTAATAVYMYVYKSDTAGNFCAVTGWDPMISVPANTWTLVEIPLAKIRQDAFGMWGVKAGETVMYSMMWAEKLFVNEETQAVIDAIDALDGTDEAAIIAARAAYEALDDAHKELVENIDKLIEMEALLGTPAEKAVEAIEAIPEKLEGYHYGFIAAAKAAVAKVAEEDLDQVTNLAKLEAAEANYAANYILVSALNDLDAIRNISSGYSSGTSDIITVEADATYGQVLKIVHSGTGALALEYDALTTDLTGGTNLIFTGYNGSSAEAPFDICQGGSFTGNGYDGTIAAGAWKTVSIAVADYTFKTATTGRVGFWGAAPGTYYLVAIYAEKDTKAVNDAIAAIDAIPETLEGYDYGLIAAAETAVASVSEEARDQITNLADLEAAKQAYEELFAVIAGATQISNVSGDYLGPGTTAAIVNDKTIGQALKVTGAAGDKIALKFSTALDLANIASVYVYIYNASEKDANAMQLIGGSWTALGALPAGQWTKAEFKVADFGTSNIFGVINADASAEFIFSVMYAEKDTKAIKNAIAAIDAIPETLEGSDYGLILAAQAAVELVAEEARDQITNLADLEAAKEEYNLYYNIVADVTDLSEATANWYGGGDAVASLTTDANYGVVYGLTYAIENPKSGVMMKFANQGDLASYGKFFLSVYNGGSTVITINYVNAAGSWVDGISIAAGEWAEVEFDATNMYEGKLIGVIGGELNATYKFTALYAETDAKAAQAAVAAIDAIPEVLEGQHYGLILAAKAAVDAVSSASQALITNLAKLEAAEEAYAKYYNLVATPDQLVDKTNDNVLGGATVSSIENDAVYGEVAVFAVNEGKKPPRLDIKIDSDIAGYEKIYVYIYNGGSTQVSALQHTSATLASVATLAAGQWTKVEYDVANFTSGKYIGVIGTIESGSVYKFSVVYAETEAKTIDNAIAAIDAIPEKLNGSDYGLIIAAKAAVALVSEAGQAQITNLADLEAAEEAYNKYFVVVSEPATFADITESWIGGVAAESVVVDETYGTVLKVDYTPGNGNFGFMINSASIVNYAKVYVSIYNGSDANAQSLYLNAGGSWTGKDVLPAGEWTTVSYNVADFNDSYVFGVFGGTAGTYKMTVVYAETEMKAIENAIAAIDAIPETLQGYQFGYIAAAQAAVELVSVDNYNLITNLADLEAAEQAYNAKYLSVLPMVEASGISENYNSFGFVATYEYAVDETYGNVLVATGIASGAAVVKYTAQLPDLSEYANVYAWVYKSTAGRYNAKQAGNWDTMHNVAGDTWTLITIPAADYTNGGFGFWDVSAGDVMMYSCIWAEKLVIASEAKAVIDMIAALSGSSEYADVVAARAAFDALSDELKAQVSNIDKLAEVEALFVVSAAIAAIDAIPEVLEGQHYGLISAAQAAVALVAEEEQDQITNLADLEAAVAAYNKYFKLIATANNFVDKTNDNVLGGATVSSVEVDATYGEVAVITVNEGKNPPRLDVKLDADLSDCDKVYVYIYNGGSTQVSALQHTSATLASVIALPAGEWTKVEYDVASFTSGKLMGVIGSITGGSVFKFSVAYAETEAKAIDNAIAAIDAIPEVLEGQHYGLILAAQAAVALVSEAGQAQITNLADLEAAVAAYNKYFVVLATPDKYADVSKDFIGGDSVTAVKVDPTYGVVYSTIFNGENRFNAFVFNPHVDASIANYQKVYTYAYNGGVNDAEVFTLNAGGSWAPAGIILPAGQWTKVELSVANLNAENGYLLGAETDANVEILYTLIFTETDAKAAEKAVEIIDALPENLEGYQYGYIAAAKEAVALVSEASKSLITNLAKLEAAEKEYNDNFVAVLPVANAANFYEKSSSFGELSTATIVEDETYGLVLVRNIHTAGAQVNYYDGGLNLDGVTTVKIYVYKTGSNGNFCAYSGWDPMQAVPANTWTLIELDVAKIRQDAFGVWNAKAGETIMYSMMWAEKPTKLVNAAIDAIDAIPEELDGIDYASISAAKAAVAAVPASAQNLITNLADLEAAEVNYAKYFAMVATADKYKDVTTGWIDGGASVSTAVVSDDTYGSVYQVTYARGSGSNMAFKLNPTDIANYVKVFTYIYNGTETNVNALYLNAKGSWTDSGITLVPGEWTKVEFAVANFNESYVIGVFGAVNGTYKFSFTYAETGLKEVEPAIAAIDAIPADITLESAGLIATAKAAVAAVPTALQSQITNIADLQAAEAAYAELGAIVSYVDTYVYNPNLGGSKANEQIVYDETYGNVFKYDRIGGSGVLYNFTPSVTLTDYDYVYVAVKVTPAAVLGAKINGSWNTEFLALNDNEWTVVEIATAELSTPGFGIWHGSADGTTVYLSTVWAANEPAPAVDITAVAQEALDNAEDGAVINLVAGDYDTLYIRQSALSQRIEVSNWAGGYNQYLRTLKNVTIKGVEGTNVKAIEFEALDYTTDGNQHSNSATMPNLKSHIEVYNLTIEGINFPEVEGNAAINFGSRKVYVDGLTIKDCSFTAKDNTAEEGRIVYYDQASAVEYKDVNTQEVVARKDIKNVTITGCVTNGLRQAVELRRGENVTITNNVFNGSQLHDLLLNGTFAGDIVISGNQSNDNAGRFIRATGWALDSLTITGNTITNGFVDEGSIVKITGATIDEANIDISGNTWNENDDETAYLAGLLIVPIKLALTMQEKAQLALDNAEDGTVIELEAGDYDTLYIRQSDLSEKVDVVGGYWNNTYLRTINNLTIKGVEGTNVKAIVVEAWQYTANGNQHSNSEAMPTLYSLIGLNNLTIEGINFPEVEGGAAIYFGYPGQVAIDGLTIQNCTFTAKEGTTDEGRILYYSSTEDKEFLDKTTGDVVFTMGLNNVTITDCVTNGLRQVVELHRANNLTISNNVFNGSQKHDLLLNGSFTGDMFISGNVSKNNSGRFIRGTGWELRTMLISNNTITDAIPDVDDGSIVKFTNISFTDTDNSNIVDNSWNGQDDMTALQSGLLILVMAQ